VRRTLELGRLHVALVPALNLDVSEHSLDDRGNALEVFVANVPAQQESTSHGSSFRNRF
jgi:hypothetical protein